MAIDLGRTPASHFSFPKLFEIASEIRRCQADPSIDGVVVVQGTDVIEETAFLWDLVLDGTQPVIVTGAMRAGLRPGRRRARQPSQRGALRRRARARGAGVQRGPRRHDQPGATRSRRPMPARWTRSSASTRGRWGGSSTAAVVVERARGPRRHVATDAAAEDVLLLTAHVAMDGALLDAAAALRPPGIVVEATGAGNTAAPLVDAADAGDGAGDRASPSRRAAPAGAAARAYAFPGGGATWVARRRDPRRATCPARRRGSRSPLGLGAGLDRAGLAALLADPPGWGPAIERGAAAAGTHSRAARA